MDLWNTNQGPIKFVTGELINMTKRCLEVEEELRGEHEANG
jgi:hypothetical protein